MKRQPGADRRGFLAMLGLGTVAGPSAAENLVKGQSFNALGIAAKAAQYNDDSDSDDSDDKMEIDEDTVYRRKPRVDSSEYHRKRIRETVDSFNELKSNNRMEELPRYIKQVKHLDPDLLANRSLSVYARIRLQAIRDLEAYNKVRLRSEESYIHNAVRRAREYLTDNECFDLVASNIIRDKTKPLPTLEAFIKVLGPRKN